MSNAFLQLSQPVRISTQVASSLAATLPTNPSFRDLPIIRYHNKRYILESQLSRKRSRGRSSWVRHHGVFLVEVLATDQPGNSFWCCTRCDDKGRPEFFGAIATSSAAEHLRRAHSIYREDPAQEDSEEEILQASSSSPTPTPSKRPRLNYSGVPKVKVTSIQDFCVATIITNDLPFCHFEDTYLRQVLQHHSSEVYSQVPWSKSSISRRIEELFQQGQSQLRLELKQAITKIHISFDLWTSPNIYAFMGITGHFLSANGLYQSRLLGFPQQLGQHTGVNQADTLLTIARLCGIEEKVGVSVSDNATNNDTCLNTLLPQLDPYVTNTDIKAHRLRCYGHILNLTCRAFLFGRDSSTLEAESDFYRLLNRHEEDLRLWRKTGAVGKLRNIVYFIRASPQRTEAFQKASREIDSDQDYQMFSSTQSETRLLLNNDTRWNSTYLMVKRAITKKVELQAFLLANQDSEEEAQRIPAADLLSPEDWKVLCEILHILEPFYLQTKRLEGWGKGDGHGRLWEVQVGMEYLLEHLVDWKTYYNSEINPVIDLAAEEASQTSQSRRGRPRRQPTTNWTFNENILPQHVRADWQQSPRTVSRFNTLDEQYQSHLRSSIELAWQKLFRYYDRLSDSPLNAASIILHPSLGISYLRDVWAGEHQRGWVARAQSELEEYFNKWYQSQQVEEVDGTSGILPIDIPIPVNEDSHFRQWVNSRRRQQPIQAKELELYLRQPPERTSDPTRWWIDHREIYPQLSQLALDILAIPAMSSDCERAFSSAKLTLTSQRLRMKPNTVEILQLLKNWLKRGTIQCGGLRIASSS
ncbi:transposase-like protein [Colletotrichum incanum]|uniref:Transposase-like protein n=1 Tax=Colletotrichum incanum TaxID=1573173 RepID=A0A166NL25_COLIC|nr:transposase-like protein [Colletotrichum incanum]